MTPRDELRRAMGDLIGVPPDHVTLFWKGRVALYAILRALGIGRGDEVVVPAFTCVAVPNAVLYTGATPVYVDIDEATYTIDPAAVQDALSPRTRAVLAQNTFGLSSDLDALTAAAAAHGVMVIDDCTHGLGGTYRGRPNGAAANAAFYSTQWSKPISTGLGGIAVTTHPAVARELAELETAAREPGIGDRALLAALLFARERIATPRTLRAGRAVYRTVSRIGVVPGSSSGDELAGTEMPDGFVTRMSTFQARLAARRLGTLGAKVDRRRAVAERYSRWLAAHGATPPHEPEATVHAFLRYPIRVRDRDAFLAEGARRGLLLGDWFHSPLYPIGGDLARWGYRWGEHPVAERVAREIANLPTDVAPDGRQAQAVEDLLEAWVERIL
ncbi:MAG TPA: aminotransferase class I/II-fold pyridoxal phosphate-dependent enzyme [Solirubrobacteraceae bacterium]